MFSHFPKWFSATGTGSWLCLPKMWSMWGSVTWKCVCQTPDDDPWKDNSWHYCFDTWVSSSVPSSLSTSCPFTHSVLFALPLCLSLFYSFFASLGSWINLFFLVLLSLSFCLHIALHAAPIKRWDWYWETIKVGLAVCWMFPPCGKWSITSSTTSDRGSCFEPAPNETSAWASGATKGEARGILLGTYTQTHTHARTGCGDLAILICFFSVGLCKTTAHFEQEVRMWLLRATLPDVACLWSTSNRTLHRTSMKWPYTACGPHCGSVAEIDMFITARQRKLRMSGRLINNKCHPASPVPHISPAFTLHLRHDARMKWQPAERLQETLQQRGK